MRRQSRLRGLEFEQREPGCPRSSCLRLAADKKRGAIAEPFEPMSTATESSPGPQIQPSHARSIVGAVGDRRYRGGLQIKRTSKTPANTSARPDKAGRQSAKGELEKAQSIDRQGADELPGDDEGRCGGAAEARRHQNVDADEDRADRPAISNRWIGVRAISETEGNWRNPTELIRMRKNQPAVKEMIVAAMVPLTPLASCAFAAI